MKKQIEVIKEKRGKIIAIIIYSSFKKNGTNFFTPYDFSQQLAFISRPKGSTIESHTHRVVKRHVKLTQETLFVKKGKVKVNLYDHKKKYLDSRILKTGDIILLASGGHGFEFLDNSEIIEVKQGPYTSDKDKMIFTP